MKKVIATVLGLAMMTSSVAFAADSANQAKLSAFQNVKTSAVSTDEMNNVSGEVLPAAYAAWMGAGYVYAGLVALAATYCWGSGRC